MDKKSFFSSPAAPSNAAPVAPSNAAPLLVFDLDGTLAETAGDLMAALNFVLEGEGLAPLPPDQARFLLGAGGRALIRRGFAAQNQEVTDERLEGLFINFLDYYNDHIAVHSHLFPGLIAALDASEEEGWRLAVCTNKMERSAIKLLTALEIASRFATIAGQDTFGVAKPEPKILARTIEAARGDPSRTIMIGDSKTDIAVARAFGAPVICVDFGYTDRPIQEYQPDAIISHFDQLGQAIKICVPLLKGGPTRRDID